MRCVADCDVSLVAFVFSDSAVEAIATMIVRRASYLARSNYWKCTTRALRPLLNLIVCTPGLSTQSSHNFFQESIHGKIPGHCPLPLNTENQTKTVKTRR